MRGKIAVVGANGFVGRHVVSRAAASGWDVTGVVRSPAAARVVVEAGGRAVELVGRDPEALVRALEGARAVVHLAQIGAERAGQTYEAVNVGFTERVIDATRAAGVGRVIYFSGLGVGHYGMTRRCTNGYFLSKLSAETRLFRSGLEGCVFRPSYVVGPGDAFVPAVLAALVAGEVERPGDGAYRMQPIAVSTRSGQHLCDGSLRDVESSDPQALLQEEDGVPSIATAQVQHRFTGLQIGQGQRITNAGESVHGRDRQGIEDLRFIPNLLGEGPANGKRKLSVRSDSHLAILPGYCLAKRV